MRSDYWNGLSLEEKLEITKTKLNIDTDDELAALLKISKRTIYNWRHGITDPSKKILYKLYQLCNIREWGSDIFGKDAFIAQYTIAYDSIRHVYKDIIASDDNLAKSNAIHSVCSKIAEVITEKSKLTKYIIVLHIHSIYGSPDYGEIINVTCIKPDGDYVNKTVDICVKIGEINGETEVVYILESVNSKGIVERRKGGNISDYSIANIANSTINYLTKQ